MLTFSHFFFEFVVFETFFNSILYFELSFIEPTNENTPTSLILTNYTAFFLFSFFVLFFYCQKAFFHDLLICGEGFSHFNPTSDVTVFLGCMPLGALHDMVHLTPLEVAFHNFEKLVIVETVVYLF